MGKYFAVVDEYEADENGQLRVKEPVFRDAVCCVKRAAFTGPDGVFNREVCATCGPSMDGIYSINEMDEFFEQKVKVMTAYAKKTEKIVGPFESPVAARIAAEKARPKAKVELLTEENEQLRIELAKLKKENK